MAEGDRLGFIVSLLGNSRSNSPHQRMNIVHIFPYSARMPGGHSNAIREFIACQRGAGLRVLGLSPATLEEFPNARELGAVIEEIDFTAPGTVMERITRWADPQPTILHLHAINRFATDLASRAKGAGMRVAMTSHGQLNYRNPLHAIKKFLYLGACRTPVRYAHGIHVLTHKERQQLRLLLPTYGGVIATIPHVIHDAGLDGDRDTGPRSRESLADKPFTILHLGRLDVVTKGLDLLVEGFAKSGLNQARLILAGPDWNHGRAALEHLANNLGCAGRVDFPGVAYGADKERLFASADLFVAASRWDAFNISLAEALLRGIPAVVSDHLNLAPELARANAVQVVPCSANAFAKGIGEVSKDPIHRKAMACRGKEWVLNHCSGNRVSAGFLTFYKQLLKFSPSP